MLATRIRQKGGTFYFASLKASALLDKVRFMSRFAFEGETIGAEKTPSDEVGEFIAKVERGERAFQRGLIRHKVKEIVNFYEAVTQQPAIPGAVLLFTDERLDFRPLEGHENLGHLSEPGGKFLVIDGQHRLAGLHFFRRHRAQEADRIDVPCMIFDSRSGDFAAEMFVIINATHTRISRSHLVELLEKVTWETPLRKFAAKIAHDLYANPRSPLQYKINKLGGRSRQEKWILQSELFKEILRVVQPHQQLFESWFDFNASRASELFIDFLRAVKDVSGEAWGNNRQYMVTTSVTLKAVVRALGDVMDDRKVLNAWRETRSEQAFLPKLEKWRKEIPRFRAEGFYERFPAKGQPERSNRIYRELKERLA